MNLNDISIREPGEAIPVGPTGDLVLVSGLPSLEAWASRAFATNPGSLLHRPAFGAGLERYLGRAGSLSQIVAACRAALLQDRRVKAARISAQASADNPGHVRVWSEVETVDGGNGQLTLEI